MGKHKYEKCIEYFTGYLTPKESGEICDCLHYNGQSDLIQSRASLVDRYFRKVLLERELEVLAEKSRLVKIAPANVVKTKADETKWERAKKSVEKEEGKPSSKFTDEEWSYVTYRFQVMKGEKEPWQKKRKK